MTVLALGAFEILHWGHIDFLMRATDFGNLTIGLTSDELLGESKRPPTFGYDERKQGLERFGWEVVPRESQSAKDVFVKVQPTYFVCGNDWLNTNHLEAMGITTKLLNRLGVTVAYLPRDHDMSTTAIIERVRRVT